MCVGRLLQRFAIQQRDIPCVQVPDSWRTGTGHNDFFDGVIGERNCSRQTDSYYQRESFGHILALKSRDHSLGRGSSTFSWLALYSWTPLPGVHGTLAVSIASFRPAYSMSTSLVSSATVSSYSARALRNESCCVDVGP